MAVGVRVVTKADCVSKVTGGHIQDMRQAMSLDNVIGKQDIDRSSAIANILDRSSEHSI